MTEEVERCGGGNLGREWRGCGGGGGAEERKIWVCNCKTHLKNFRSTPNRAKTKQKKAAPFLRIGKGEKRGEIHHNSFLVSSAFLFVHVSHAPQVLHGNQAPARGRCLWPTSTGTGTGTGTGTQPCSHYRVGAHPCSHDRVSARQRRRKRRFELLVFPTSEHQCPRTLVTMHAPTPTKPPHFVP